MFLSCLILYCDVYALAGPLISRHRFQLQLLATAANWILIGTIKLICTPTLHPITWKLIN